MKNYLVELYSGTETLRTTLAAETLRTTLAAETPEHAQELASTLIECLTERPGGLWRIASLRLIG